MCNQINNEKNATRLILYFENKSNLNEINTEKNVPIKLDNKREGTKACV